jgi:hypothetical protein
MDLGHLAGTPSRHLRHLPVPETETSLVQLRRKGRKGEEKRGEKGEKGRKGDTHKASATLVVLTCLSLSGYGKTDCGCPLFPPYFPFCNSPRFAGRKKRAGRPVPMSGWTIRKTHLAITVHESLRHDMPMWRSKTIRLQNSRIFQRLRFAV